MTALVACLGFVQMSIATMTGAEVQKTACRDCGRGAKLPNIFTE
jgi:hypothetical protein